MGRRLREGHDASTPLSHLNGWAPTRRLRAEDLGWRPLSPPRRVQGTAAPSTLEGAPLGPRRLEGREGGGSGVQVRVGGGWGDGGAMSPGAGRAECSFLLSFPLFLFSSGLGRRRSGSPTRISNAHISTTPSRGNLDLCAKNTTSRKPAAYCFYGMHLHTFGNHMHRVEFPRLEHGSNYGEPISLTLVERCETQCQLRSLQFHSGEQGSVRV